MFDDFKTAAAVIAALLSFLVSIVTAILSYAFNRKNQHDLERLRAELEEKRRERDALRDYEYEARKRLYHECGPLLLQLMELAETAQRRITGLARTAWHGHLGSHPDAWLHDTTSYYSLSTVYWLLAPLAIVKLLQRRLTLIDFSLDRRIFTQYSLAKEVYDTFSGDFRLALLTPELPYDPESPGAKDKRAANPQVYWKQGIHRGLVDIAAESLVVTEPGSIGRVKSFGEFEQECLTPGTPINKTFQRLEYLIRDFHPATRPVLWRMLIVHAHLYQALLLAHGSAGGLTRAALHIPAKERAAYDWRQPAERAPGQVSEQTAVGEPFALAEKYLGDRIGFLFGDPELQRVTVSSVVARAAGSSPGRTE
jgi:hypothetical protein